MAVNSTSTVAPRQAHHSPLTADSYVTIVVIFLVLVALIFDMAPCHAVMFVAALTLCVTGVISSSQMFEGFSESGVVTIAMLFIVVAPIPHLPIVRRLVEALLHGRAPLLKLCIACFALTWCTGNIPLVALMLPLVKSYCREHEVPPSYFLMSINAAALLGGTFSVIGTSTNLVYTTLMEDFKVGTCGFFENAKVGLLPAALVTAYLCFAPQFLLRARNGLLKSLREGSQSFVAQFRVLSRSPLIGSTVSTVTEQLPQSLRNSIMVVDHRPGGKEPAEALNATPPDAPLDSPTKSPRGARARRTIAAGDRLMLAGAVADLHSASTLLHVKWEATAAASSSDRAAPDTELGDLAAIPESASLAPVPEGSGDDRDFFEVVVGHNCPLVGRFVGDGGVHTRYNASLLSLRRRDGQDLVHEADINSHTVEVGDTLLILGSSSFANDFGHDFFVVSQLAVPDTIHPFVIEVPECCCVGRRVAIGSSKRRSGRGGLDVGLLKSREGDAADDTVRGESQKVVVLPDAFRNVALLVFLGMVAAAVAGVKIQVASACAVAVMVMLRLVSVRDAIKAIDFELIIMIAFSFTLGAAINNSHIAVNLADALAGKGITGFPLLLLVSVTAAIFTNLITGKASAQVMVPLTVELCRVQGIDPFPACVLLMCTTAVSMATPYGHPSNLLIFGPGGYVPMDFVKFGLPLNLILCVLHSLMTAIVYDQW